MLRHLIRALVFGWRGWRPVATDPPPVGELVLGLCSYTGLRAVTARRDDIHFRQWDNWYINHPTHWTDIPRALPRTAAPPAMPDIIAREGFATPDNPTE
ncbi:MAG: hypothetical protein U1A73_27250 [Pseudomonas sp.]|nr:hypothetical protein [Pseudomonas sp.]